MDPIMNALIMFLRAQNVCIDPCETVRLQATHNNITVDRTRTQVPLWNIRGLVFLFIELKRIHVHFPALGNSWRLDSFKRLATEPIMCPRDRFFLPSGTLKLPCKTPVINSQRNPQQYTPPLPDPSAPLPILSPMFAFSFDRQLPGKMKWSMLGEEVLCLQTHAASPCHCLGLSNLKVSMSLKKVGKERSMDRSPRPSAPQ